MTTWCMLAVVLLLGQGDATETPPAHTPAAPAADYIIGPEDLLEIEVFQLDELTTTARVGQDGTIRFPLLGNVEVKGLTRSLLENRLAELLAERYVRDPQVTVFIKEYRSSRVSVLGAVERPGTYELVGSKRLLDMLGMAGGVSQDAGSTLLLIRQGIAEPVEVDLDALLREGLAHVNLEVRAGDVVNVPKLDTITVFVYGEVENPGSFDMDRERTVTVLQAVATAGGLTRRASAGKVKIHRQVGDTGETRILKLDLKKVIEGKRKDMVLEDGDIVVVPRSFF